MLTTAASYRFRRPSLAWGTAPLPIVLAREASSIFEAYRTWRRSFDKASKRHSLFIPEQIVAWILHRSDFHERILGNAQIMSSRRVYAPNSNDEDVVPVSTNIDEAHTESADRVRAIGEAALAVASRRINARGKRAIDLIIGAAALAFVLPLIASLIVLLRLDGRGPAIVGTQKIGRRGRPFTQFFFRRSRFGDGEANVPGEGPGLIARLPGLWNVVTGDLSLVGAPAVDRDGLDAYGQDRRFYLVARPGLTAPWGEEAVRSANLPALCRDYVLNWRLRRDLAVLWAAFSDRPRPRAR